LGVLTGFIVMDDSRLVVLSIYGSTCTWYLW